MKFIGIGQIRRQGLYQYAKMAVSSGHEIECIRNSENDLEFVWLPRCEIGFSYSKDLGYRVLHERPG